jgi:CRP/FNR family transcriptional regulator
MNTTIFTDKQLLDDIEKYTRLKTIVRDEVLMQPGDKVVFVPIVKSGVLRIVRQNADGREVFLYHLYPGQTCAMAINCCQGNRRSSIKAIAEDETELILVPVNMVEEWMKSVPLP